MRETVSRRMPEFKVGSADALRLEGVLLRPCHLNAIRLHRHISLELHLGRRRYIQFHIRTMLQQGPCYATSKARQSAIARSIESASGGAADCTYGPSYSRALCRIFHSLARVLVRLNRSFRVLYVIRVSTRSILDRSWQHDGIATRIDH